MYSQKSRFMAPLARRGKTIFTVCPSIYLPKLKFLIQLSPKYVHPSDNFWFCCGKESLIMLENLTLLLTIVEFKTIKRISCTENEVYKYKKNQKSGVKLPIIWFSKFHCSVRFLHFLSNNAHHLVDITNLCVDSTKVWQNDSYSLTYTTEKAS